MSKPIDFSWFGVRRVRLNDLPSIYKIDSTSLVSNFSVDAMLERIVLYNDFCYAAYENFENSVIGYIIGTSNTHYTRNFPGYIYISRFAVKDAYRRRGVGTTLLAILENNLIATGNYLGTVADVRKSNAPSLYFFDKNGYSRSENLSKAGAYDAGNTDDDRYKIVIYKQFGSD
jgi:ribosomal protein S18 acetylase RimI-like enzyme